MTALANRCGAVNLAQGFPDFDGPEVAKEGAIGAIRGGEGQYSRMIGVPPLNEAIAKSWEARGFGRRDPETEVTVTSGCSEAIVAALMGLFDPGDEVVVFEPFFDFYTACSAMAGLKCRFVTLRPPSSGAGAFTFDEGELARAFTPRTRAVIVNTPHNPTGKVYTREELGAIARLCQKHGAIAITDEVYEHLVYEPTLPHVPLATIPGMEDRTVTLSSLGKTFSLTGWKVGWAIASPGLSAGVRAAHQFLTFCSATPLQHGGAAALANPGEHTREVARLYAENRDVLSRGLEEAGLRVFPSHSTYFVMADHSGLGLGDDRGFCIHLAEKVGVAAIPPGVFYSDRATGRDLVRFAYCKKRETIAEAVRRLRALKRAGR